MSTTPLSETEIVAEALRRCRNRFDLFNEHILKRPPYWARQRDICSSVVQNRVTVVSTGNSIGKSVCASGLLLGWLFTRPNSIVVATSASNAQLQNALFANVKHAYHRSPYLARYFHSTVITEGFSSPQRLTIAPNWYAVGMSVNGVENLSGIHGSDLLVLVDESSGVSEAAHEALLSLGANRYVYLGNPLRSTGWFADEIRRAQAGAPNYGYVQISSLDSPHADLEKSPSGLADRGLIESFRAFGETSYEYRVHILGLLPDEDVETLIPLSFLTAAQSEAARDIALSTPSSDVWLGCDPSGGVSADRSAVIVRNENRILDSFVSNVHGVLPDARHRIEPVIVDLVKKYNVPHDQVIYDANGVGRNLGEYLKGHGIDGAIGYFGGGRPLHNPKRYNNLRTECCFKLKRRLDPSIPDRVPFYFGEGPHLKPLIEEIKHLRQRESEMSSDGPKVCMERREDMSRRLGHSPDCLDSLLMTLAFSPW